MKIAYLFVWFLSLTTLGAAEKTGGYLIRTTFVYRNAQNKETSVFKEMILPADHRTWVTLTDSEDNVVLLGRPRAADGSSIDMEYVVVDGNLKPNGVVATPSIRSRFNEPAVIKIGKGAGSASITLLAKATEYTGNK